MLQTFTYRNNPITFSRDGEVMVNATHMAKPFGKRTNDFLSNSQTESFIQAYLTRSGKSRNDILEVVQGGATQGTWMHQKIALKFAAWLSPEFELWVFDRIEELLLSGKTEINPMNPAEMKLQVFRMLEQEAESLKEQLQLANATIQDQAPKVKYFHDVIDSTGLIPMTTLAQGFDMTVDQFKKELIKRGILWKKKVGGVWVLSAKYQGKGYSKVKPYAYTDSLGRPQTKNDTYFTQKFRECLHSIFNSQSNAA